MTPAPARSLRVAVLASGWAGFNDAACRELASRGVELLVVTPSTAPDTDYADLGFGEYAQVHLWHGAPADGEVREVVRAFAPDAVLMHSWHFGPYREAVRALPAGTLRVCWMDNVWRNVAKQWVGRVVAPWWVQSIFDCVMVPSDRTEFFARRLGFGEDQVIRGSLAADTSVFGSEPRTGEEIAGHRAFLACQRLVHHKGADVLADAYRRYRAASTDPWDLAVAGLGPLASDFEGIDGVRMLGFQQPGELATLMRSSSAFVLPSRIDPYGVALHEAAVSGLPLITTYQVGAAPSFVQDGQNGWTVASGDAAALAASMGHMAALADDPAGVARLGEMSDLSRALGSRTSSVGWARNLHEQLTWRLEALRS
ncbi:MAG: glycosyltransferase family 4 protein [Aeromicrobium sp.]|uniref:glycosyltransferase family 4 protein n=1 Tax=Aeromicrobium sp. TaxID=1871063 RepID=UPI0025BA352D|nr:glycosyltransferase family 4 protein [Aeromicrobium sp.]MCK5891564.1 glycosyltransferase family 4 protein [Aeromicrobium sp.]MDF1704804.1 glycosyltransferase family 4 protein [Aeromicrobium sp.]